jgi:hypothetical protein
MASSEILGWVSLLAAVVASHFRLENRVKMLSVLAGIANKRLDRLEKAAGITNGESGGIFVSRRECVLMEGFVQKELSELKAVTSRLDARIDSIDLDVKELVREWRGSSGPSHPEH